MTKHITKISPRIPSGANAMTSKGNVVLYLDKELVEKSKELGVNLSKTFENHLKQLMTQFSALNQENTSNITINNVKSSPGVTVPRLEFILKNPSFLIKIFC